MPSLRQRLNRPGLWLSITVAFYAAVIIDLARPPREQLAARAYVDAVGVYQLLGRPMLAGTIRCRFSPSCSEYSVDAVSRHGLVRGLSLTFARIGRCDTSVPLGTLDPVPR